jgi:hypothetical protein
MNFSIFGDLDINLFDEGDADMNKTKKDVCVESDLPCNHDDDIHLVQTYEAYEAYEVSLKREECEGHEARQVREINRKSIEDINNSEKGGENSGENDKEPDAIMVDDTDIGICDGNIWNGNICNGNIWNDIYVNLRPFELLITTAAVEEVIFKKHLVEILNKHSRECVMEGVVVGYDLVGRSYDPDIVLKFQDGRTFYNENFGYLLRYYI